jgi:hypothetical protein
MLFFYLCRWVSLIPAFVIGTSIGPALVELIFGPPGIWEHYLFWFAFLGLVLGSLGATLICAWVVPEAKWLIGISVAVLSIILGPISSGQYPNRALDAVGGLWGDFAGRLVGAIVALLILSKILRSAAK